MILRITIILTFISLSDKLVSAQSPPRGSADYAMNVFFDDEAKTLTGETQVKWFNPDQKAVGELQFHLYYNAFLNAQSTFLSRNQNLGFLLNSLEEECGWSFSNLLSCVDEQGNELIKGSEFTSPDDDNSLDRTVLRIPLVNPVAGQDTAVFQLKWEAKIPKSMVRTGYNQDFYFFAQWYPKLGVYEPPGMRYEEEGNWNCHQYHAIGEYYGEFGDYRVTLNVPSKYVVGASGQLVNEEKTGDRSEFTFSVEQVIDFTWTCSPQYEVIEDRWNEVDLTLLTYPGHEVFHDRYLKTAKQCLEYLDQYVGAYPYPTLTMVDPPLYGLFTGGMEYPTLITSISSKLLPTAARAPETLVVHEFVHQYFMQLVATHEQEEPWMDEGVTTYYEGRIMDHFYGPNSSLFNFKTFKLGNSEYNRYQFWSMENPRIADNSFSARDFVNGGYGPIAYNKTAMMLKTLDGILGREKFDRIMQIYFDRWKYNHPCGLDFISVFEEEVDESLQEELQFDLDLFFKQALYGTAICDYRVASINSNDEKIIGGFMDDLDSCSTLSRKEGELVQRVVLERLSEMILPVDVQVNFENGESVLQLWDGKSYSKELVFTNESRISNVILDPFSKLDLERNTIDNSLTQTKQNSVKKYTSRYKIAIQHLLDFLNFLS